MKPRSLCLIYSIAVVLIAFSRECHAQFHYDASMNQYGIMSAFGDFFSKRRADVFETNSNGTEIKLLTSPTQPTAYVEESLLDLSSLLTSSNGELTSTIVNVVPYDFDGDALTDVLVTTASLDSQTGPFTLTVFWNTGGSLNLSVSTTVTDSLLDHAFIVDWNADAYPDIFGELREAGNRVVFIALPNRTFQMFVLGTGNPLCRPGSHAFVNFLGIQSQSGIVLCTVTQAGATGDMAQRGAPQNVAYEYWSRNLSYKSTPASALNYTQLFKLSTVEPIANALSVVNSTGSIVYVGQPAFADLNSDGQNVQLIPICVASCVSGSYIVALTYNGNNNYSNWSLAYKYPSNYWIVHWLNHTVKTSMPPPITAALTYSLSVGDYNLDGYPDLLAMVTNGTYRKPVILQNAQNGQFSLRNADFWDVEEPVNAAFYDVQLDGVLDVLVTDLDPSGVPLTRFYLSGLTGYNAYFLKTYILNGLCNAGGCATVPYGVQICGATVGYDTVSVNGSPLQGIASQQPQTAHFALQPIYTLFGLSTEPNYVNQLSVRIPSREDDRYRDWTSLIPNTQLIVLTSPPQMPASWTAQLFLQPLENNRVLYVAFALIGAFVLVAIIVIVLQILEVREDRHERLLEAQRFHFDTM